MSTQKILKQRQKTHGEFKTHAAISQKLKNIVREHGAGKLTAEQFESLEMVCHKMARILNGKPNHKDHWVDIAGYAELVAQNLKDEKS